MRNWLTCLLIVAACIGCEPVEEYRRRTHDLHQGIHWKSPENERLVVSVEMTEEYRDLWGIVSVVVWQHAPEDSPERNRASTIYRFPVLDRPSDSFILSLDPSQSDIEMKYGYFILVTVQPLPHVNDIEAELSKDKMPLGMKLVRIVPESATGTKQAL